MRFSKRRLLEAEQGYSVASLTLLGTTCVLCASESPDPAMVFPVPGLEPAVLASEPGGCMGFAGLPGRDDALLMITEFYPVFRSENAGVHLYTAVDGFSRPWRGRRVLDLPFVHRIATVAVEDRGYLVAATVCAGKAFQDDWSKPGAVYGIRIPENLDEEWRAQPVLEGIHKNHGMNVGTYHGRRTVFISGTQGVFALFVPERSGDPWEHEQIIDHEVSEVFPYDLDGDGQDELAVIEPFHGDTLAVYKRSGVTWDRVFAAELGFGHGLWAGRLAGDGAVIVGNRAGSKHLCCYRVASASPFQMEEIVIDPGAGTTNMTVIDLPEGRAVVASNPLRSEYALYRVE